MEKFWWKMRFKKERARSSSNNNTERREPERKETSGARGSFEKKIGVREEQRGS